MTETPIEAARRLSSPILSKGYEPPSLHSYTNENAEVLFHRIRAKNVNTGEKWIRPMRLNDGKFELGEPKFPSGKPLYALHHMSSNPKADLWVVEGEQKADALNKLGLIATTSGGATSARTTDWEPVRGHTICIWPDNDVAGKGYAAEVARILLRMGCVVSCVDVEMIGLAESEDVIQWLEMHPDATTFEIESLPKILASSGGNDAQAAVSEAGEGRAHAIPEPLPNLPAVSPFDYGYMPDAVRNFVRDISERMQCPPDFAAVGVYVMLATALGRKIGIRPMRQNDWTVIPNLWGAVVGHSGVMKSPTLAAALTPIKKLQGDAYAAFNHARANFEEAAELVKLQKSVKKTAARASLKDNHSADIKHLLQSDTLEEMPKLKRLITNNATYEALGEILMENPNGLMVEADEIIGLLKQLDASGQEVARSFYLTAADGDKSYTFDRVIRGKAMHIEAVCLSILGGIQPGVLAEYVRQAMGGGAGADGLLQRFGLMVYPDISPDWKEVDRHPDSEALNKVQSLVGEFDQLVPAYIGTEVDSYGSVPFLRFDDAAQKVFSQWREKLEIRLRSGEEHPAIVSHLAKYRKLVPSLALINHMCDCKRNAVEESALLRAIAFSEYLETHARRIYSYAVRPDIDAAKTILKRLANGKLPPVFTARELAQKHWTGLESPAKAQAAINLLLEYQHLVETKNATGGRPTAHFQWIQAGGV